MTPPFTFKATVKQFPGKGGWVYVPVPQKYTEKLKSKRRAWGMYPITATVGNTTWKTKLMMMKGGSYFVALKAAVRKKESIAIGEKITISFVLE